VNPKELNEIEEHSRKLARDRTSDDMSRISCVTDCRIGEYTVHLYSNGHGLPALMEGLTTNISKGYSIRKDPPHGGQGQTHFHVIRRDNELMAVNMDGTGHDGSSGYTLPGVVANWLQKNVDGINIRQDRVIEMITARLDGLLLG